MPHSRKPRRAPLREVRERRTLSLSDLAQLSHVDRMTIHRIEQGRHSPFPRTRRRLAEALRIAVDRIDWNGSPSAPDTSAPS